MRTKGALQLFVPTFCPNFLSQLLVPPYLPQDTIVAHRPLEDYTLPGRRLYFFKRGAGVTPDASVVGTPGWGLYPHSL
jgi:hypothetical protein